MKPPNDKEIDQQLDDEQKGEVLVAAVELRRRRAESQKRLQNLRDERRVLEEIRDALVAEEKIVAQRLANLNGDQVRLTGKINSMTKQNVEMDGEVEQINREITLLECRYSEIHARELELNREINLAEEALDRARQDISRATDELELGRSSLAKMDQKLSLKRLKR